MRVVAALLCACSAHPHPERLSNTASARPPTVCIVHCQAVTDTGFRDAQLVVAADGTILDEGATVGRIAADGRVFMRDALFATLGRDGALRLLGENTTLHIAPDGTAIEDDEDEPKVAFHADNTMDGTILPGRNCRYEGPPARRSDAAIAVFVLFRHEI